MAASLAVLVAGCGSNSGDGGSALVDPDKPPLINSLEVDPATEDLLLTTNQGFFRVSDGEATPIEAEVKTPDGTSPVGTFMALGVAPDGGLIASGHPDNKQKLAPFLGLLGSRDDGSNWTPLSRYGLADLHVMHSVNDLLYAYDAVLPGLLVSTDGGKTWEERSAPIDLVIDFVVDPDDPDHLLASTEGEIFRSTDGGRSWTSAARAFSARMDWPAPDTLYRTDEDGLVYVSEDHGSTWEIVGRIDGEPWKLKAVSSDQLYAALSDATVLASTDGGQNWVEHFSP